MNYKTDEEILHMINELEKEPLYSPPHLKAEILEKLAKLEKVTAPAAGAKTPGSLFIYNLKVVAGVAAALALIFTLPHTIEAASWREQVCEQRVAAAQSRYLNEDIEAESGLDKIFRTGTAALNGTADLLLDKINILSSFPAVTKHDYN